MTVLIDTHVARLMTGCEKAVAETYNREGESPIRTLRERSHEREQTAITGETSEVDTFRGSQVSRPIRAADLL